jgi:hypothetical protein
MVHRPFILLYRCVSTVPLHLFIPPSASASAFSYPTVRTSISPPPLSDPIGSWHVSFYSASTRSGQIGPARHPGTPFHFLLIPGALSSLFLPFSFVLE